MSRGSRLKTFDQCSRTKKLVVILISGFLLLVLGYSVDLNFLQKSLRLKQKELGMIKELLQTKKKELRPEKLMRSLEPSLSEICIANSSSSIPKQGIIDILHGIERVMILSRVEAAFFEPQAVTANEIMVIYPVKFAVTGQYKNLLTFINNLLKQPYFVVIEELMVQKNGEHDDNLSGQILLKIYQSQRELSKNKIYSQLLINQSSIDIPERDIFKLSTVAMSLDLWSSKELAFLGLVKQGELTLGIVSDPLGEIYRVAVGDRIGLNQSKITAIDKHGITTVNRTDNLLHGN